MSDETAKLKRASKFQDHYTNVKWGSVETISGSGSRISKTVVIRRELQKLIDESGAVKPLLVCDLGCGDLNWIKEVDLGTSVYIGMDIVPDIIQKNLLNYSGLGFTFRTADVVEATLPKADIVVCKDLLTHLPLDDCLKLLENIIQSGSKILVAYSNAEITDNATGKLGGWRNLNLEAEPFNFPKPLKYVKEKGQKKYFGIWEVQSIARRRLDQLAAMQLPVFAKVASISTSNRDTDPDHPLTNLTEGPGKGFDANAPYSGASRNYWATNSTGPAHSSYFEQYAEPIELDISLSQVETIDCVGLWSNGVTFGDSPKNLTIQFSPTADPLALSDPIPLIAKDPNPFDIELFRFAQVNTSFIRVTIQSNHSEVGLGGNRVAFQEIAFGGSYEKIISNISASSSQGYQQDCLRTYLGDDLSDLSYAILNIRPEFSLDHLWKPGTTYRGFQRFRGMGGRGPQIKRIGLASWGDKIYIHHWLKENGFKGMPVLHFANRLSGDFIAHVEQLYDGGLRSFVLKMSHLGDSVGVYRIRDGLFITPNEVKRKTAQYGKPVDFQYLAKEIEKNWTNQQYHEDWASNMIPPGVILEELLDDATELKFSVVFGRVVGFFIEKRGLPSFGPAGENLKNPEETLPDWWEEACRLVERVALLVRADHVRIDILRHKGELIVNEINWNGGERPENQTLIAEKLNEGYEFRRSYLPD